VSDRLNMLKNWRQSLSGYSDGVRALLRAPAGKITGLIGPVAQLGVAPAGMEAAMEAALGQYLQSVVVSTIDDAYISLRYLQSAAQGKALVVWMVDGHDRQQDKAFTGNGTTELQDEEKMLGRFLLEQVALREDVSGFAWQHIQCEERYLPLFRRILHGIIIVKDVETAQTLLTRLQQSLPITASNDVPFKIMVTLTGEMLHADGWLTGGNDKEGGQNGQHGLLAHERELRELPRQLSTHVALIEQLNGMVSEVQRGQEVRRAEQNAIDKELQKLTARINEFNKIANMTQRDLERIQTELQLASSVEQQLAAEMLGLEQEVQAAQERVRAHEKSQREIASLVEEFQREMEERALIFRRQQDELGRARTALAVKRQEAKALRQQLVTQQGQAQDIKGQIEQHLARVKVFEQQRQALEEAITGYRVEYAKVQAQARKLTEELRVAEGQAAAIDTNIAVLEKQNLALRHTMADGEGVYRRSLMESQKARDALETLLQQLEEEMGVTDPKELNRYAVQADVSSEMSKQDDSAQELDEPDRLSEAEEIQLRRLRRRVDTLRSRIKSLGGYDPDAPQQYEETRTRFEFLSTQIADMEQAALHLRSIIGQLDVTMARQFEATFQAVNERFREHFTTLFNGGNARLELTTAKANDDDTSGTSIPSNMSAGVDVIVQPPGKKVQDLALLSGGERALVSAALLFALLEINPPPFCLLDEVDAALDESNVTRFCDILKRLAQRTQFIMITHNRVTMTSAQVIYGVSMGNDSVSRLLSMKLEEAPVAGDR
ncbi:MAG TPA: AAA family ATPase, partial [Ktedonobacteraceae bacterium]|nr:AAA family ATPase [Ktedonobacteraceae bacterium]